MRMKLCLCPIGQKIVECECLMVARKREQRMVDTGEPSDGQERQNLGWIPEPDVPSGEYPFAAAVR